MLNVRIIKEMEDKLNSYSQQNNLPKSAIVKEALAMYFKKKVANLPMSWVVIFLVVPQAEALMAPPYTNPN
ncbi:MAG: hypothetical protein ACI8TA_003210 [Cyclobacteriaceae bacterium]|jgi:hypothetical protein